MGVGAALKKTAPWISTILSVAGTATGNPLLGFAAKAVSEVSNHTVKADAIEIQAAIDKMTPEQYLALHDKDAEVGEQMQKLGYDHIEAMQRMELDDRESARARQIAVKDSMPAVLAILAVVSLLACIALVAFVNLPQGAREAVLLLLGFVGASYKDVYGYFFGSSKGSDEKTAIMAAQNKGEAK